MKRKQLTMAQLGMMSNALMKNLFPIPTKTQLLVEEKSSAKGDGLYLYFTTEYFDKLTQKMQEQSDNGSYAKSNAQSDWIDLMQAVMSAENVSNADMSNLRAHFLAK
jgi:hypothetical protein